MNSCKSCKRRYHCCINPPSKGYVSVFIDEAKLIKKKTGLVYNEFLSFSKLPKRIVELSKHDLPYSEAKFRSGMMLDGRILKLKTRSNGECVFLKDGKCTIYKIRPSICRIYPYWFKQTKKGIELIIHTGCEYCSLLKEPVNKKELLKTAKTIIKEKTQYKKNIKNFIKKNIKN